MKIGLKINKSAQTIDTVYFNAGKRRIVTKGYKNQ